jgi:hypothetical protein
LFAWILLIGAHITEGHRTNIEIRSAQLGWSLTRCLREIAEIATYPAEFPGPLSATSRSTTHQTELVEINCANTNAAAGRPAPQVQVRPATELFCYHCNAPHTTWSCPGLKQLNGHPASTVFASGTCLACQKLTTPRHNWYDCELAPVHLPYRPAPPPPEHRRGAPKK